MEDYDGLSVAGADWLQRRIEVNPAARVLLATGNTPIGIYREMAQRRARREWDSSHLIAFQLDSYLGIGPDDGRSLYGWLAREFLDPCGISPDRVVRLPGDSTDPSGVCAAYERAVAEHGGLDLSILGLGPNGHLGFNEPPSGPDVPTRVVDLTPASVASNAAYWGGEALVPRQALTAGMNAILAARETLLVVSGAHKREILQRTLMEPVTPDLPASLLRQSPALTVLADRDAAGDLAESRPVST